jgi:hypothetical protein
MVHALKECWRVLVAGGQLLDMRPIVGGMVVQVVTDSSTNTTGEVDDSEGKPDDEAADRAMAAMVEDGYFARERVEHFQFAYYWDSLPGMQAYIDERWGDFAVLPKETLRRTQRKIKALKEALYRLSVLETIQLIRYKKLLP